MRARRCLSLSPSHVSSPPAPSNRTCGFPASHGSHPGSCPSLTESPCRAVRPGAARSPRARPEERTSPPAPNGRQRHRQQRSRPGGSPTAAAHPAATPPSLPHAAPAGVSGHSTEVLGSRHSPRPFPPFLALFPEPGPLPSAGITRPLAVLRAHPPPCRPELALAGSRLVRAHHRQGFPCCHCFPLTRMLPSLPRRNRPVLASLASQPLATFPVYRAGRLPHWPFRGLLNVRCSLRPARSLSRPRRPL